MTPDQMRAVCRAARTRQQRLDGFPNIYDADQDRRSAAQFARQALPQAEVRVRGDGTIVFALGGHAHEWAA